MRSPSKFLFSLSQSLQSLCHGYLEFDSEVEIVGYIHVRIDKERQSDFVLSEKFETLAGDSFSVNSQSFLASSSKKIDNTKTPIPSNKICSTVSDAESCDASNSFIFHSNEENKSRMCNFARTLKRRRAFE